MSKYEVFSGPYFPVFGINTERYTLSVRIQSECGKIGTRKNSVFWLISRSEGKNKSNIVSGKFTVNSSKYLMMSFYSVFILLQLIFYAKIEYYRIASSKNFRRKWASCYGYMHLPEAKVRLDQIVLFIIYINPISALVFWPRICSSREERG